MLHCGFLANAFAFLLNVFLILHAGLLQISNDLVKLTFSSSFLCFYWILVHFPTSVCAGSVPELQFFSLLPEHLWVGVVQCLHAFLLVDYLLCGRLLYISFTCFDCIVFDTL